MVGATGIEPVTSALSVLRSNHLSYAPPEMVGGKGIEPLTSSV